MIRMPTAVQAAPSPAGPRDGQTPVAAAPDLRTDTWRPIVAGVMVIAVAFGGLGTWAAVAPLNSAAIAPGVVAVASNRKTVQHLEGGIIDAILVRDGDAVSAGDPLVRLRDTQVRATLEILTGRYHALRAVESRLIAERDELDGIEFPDDLLLLRDDSEVAQLMAAQEALFQARRQALQSETELSYRRIAESYEEIAGWQAQVEALDEELRYVTEEALDVEGLLVAGNALKPRLLALRRQMAEVEGGRGEAMAEIARARQRIAEAEQRIVYLRHERINEVAHELQDVAADIFDQRERIRATEDVLQRLEVRAPEAGKVVGLRFHTPGGVVAPGEPILDLVPQDDRLLIEAQVQPEDIDVVHAGLRAEVRLIAYNARTTPIVDGEVVQISADRLEDVTTGAPYYLARIRLDSTSLSRLDEVTLYPGMPAEAFIVTGERTALQYMLSPLVNSMSRALRER